jgi:hypothetical protein
MYLQIRCSIYQTHKKLILKQSKDKDEFTKKLYDI